MRVVSGTKRGTKLFGFEKEDEGKRATLDHVKEAMFDKIQFLVPNSVVLDLFGGTGALGLECISRGASEVVIVEKESECISIIRKNADKLGFCPTIIQSDYDLALKKMGDKQFDVILLDPPFNSHYGDKALKRIHELDRLSASGVIVYEHIKGKRVEVPKGLMIIDEKNYGSVTLTYLEQEVVSEF